ncbi:MAG: signal peptidase [Micromonosporaceae bacterium]|nr:signal peptidase [Micromonosporaceae bacterium]MDT5035782.1 signal peptidase [Micromonosporaceae bacterium]
MHHVQAAGGAALNDDEAVATDRPPDSTTEPDGAAEAGHTAAASGSVEVGHTAAAGGAVDADQTAGGALRRRSLGVFGAVGCLVLLLDIATKQWAVAGLTGREPVRLPGGAVYLLLVRNSGAAFSLGTGYTFVFPLITLVVVAWIGWTARRLLSLPWAIAFGLILGGALGNLTDRIFRAPGFLTGHVIDFVSLFDRNGQGWPVFNAADSALCVGVALAVALELTGRRLDGTRAAGAGRGSVPDSAGG